MTVNLHRIDWDNLGDQACSPARYFKELSGVRRVDMDDEWPMAKTFIVGGGGLLHGKWTEKLSRLTDTGANLIAWGVGMNQHDTTEFIYPKFLDQFAKVGLRDWGNPWDCVPCPSCLHPAFDRLKAAKPIRPYAIYEHHLYPIPIYSDIPRMQNRQPFSFFEEAIRFLARAEVVITNTFHGAYWAMLLGRRVVIFRPFSTRFHCFQENPVCADVDDWMEKTALAAFPPFGYLEDCRALNQNFFLNSVKPLLA